MCVCVSGGEGGREGEGGRGEERESNQGMEQVIGRQACLTFVNFKGIFLAFAICSIKCIGLPTCERESYI